MSDGSRRRSGRVAQRTALSPCELQQARREGCVFVVEGLDGADVRLEDAMTESGGQRMQQGVDGALISTVQVLLEGEVVFSRWYDLCVRFFGR